MEKTILLGKISFREKILCFWQKILQRKLLFGENEFFWGKKSFREKDSIKQKILIEKNILSFWAKDSLKEIIIW